MKLAVICLTITGWQTVVTATALVPWPSQVYNSLYAPFLNSIEELFSARRWKGVWSQTPWTYGPSPGNGGGLWWHSTLIPVRGGCMMLEDISLLSGQGGCYGPVMLMKICSRTNTQDMTDFVFTIEYLFLDLWFYCISTVSLSVLCNWSNVQ